MTTQTTSVINRYSTLFIIRFNLNDHNYLLKHSIINLFKVLNVRHFKI